MRSILAAVFGGVLSWWGLCLIAALDSTMFFFLPLGVDAAVVLLASRNRGLFWLYPILASVGSILGASITYYIGRRLGEAGLKWFIQPNQMKRFRTRIENKGAVALAVLDLLPPPFPFTACVLVAGALKVDTWLFFVTLFITRLLRFGLLLRTPHRPVADIERVRIRRYRIRSDHDSFYPYQLVGLGLDW